MAVAKRTGPDFLFLANTNSQKFDDIEKNKIVNISFQNSNNTDWISITGEVVTSSNDNPRIKEVYSKQVSAWFGNLGDGVHTGGPEDPRIKLIEVQAKCTRTFPGPTHYSTVLTCRQISLTGNMKY
jgi:general stress protein 26